MRCNPKGAGRRVRGKQTELIGKSPSCLDFTEDPSTRPVVHYTSSDKIHTRFLSAAAVSNCWGGGEVTSHLGAQTTVHGIVRSQSQSQRKPTVAVYCADGACVRRLKRLQQFIFLSVPTIYLLNSNHSINERERARLGFCVCLSAQFHGRF